MNYKVLITTSGLGTRLGEITKYTNKSLARVGKKPVISYIIENYPKETEFVLTVGYFSDQVKEFISLAYPDRKITFVEVDKFQGEGSSLGYSMLCAKKYLQCPFIFHAGDTIVDEVVPVPSENWNGGFRGESAASYSSFNTIGGNVSLISEKGAIDFDFLHIGLVGINDYESFWEYLERACKNNPNDSSINDCTAMNGMITQGLKFRVQEFKTWFDIGNVESLNYAKKNIKDSIPNLDKADESIYIFDDYVIKFFYNTDNIKQRVERGKNLSGLVPEILGSTPHFYKYKFVEGDLYSRVVNPTDFLRFLSWARNNLWKPLKDVEGDKFSEICRDFYDKKTLQRVEKFLEKSNLKDEQCIINGETVPPFSEMYKMIDFEWLCRAQQYQFHGDFILDNIIKTENGYCLLDWRQNFGGLLQGGDMYYDLAKLNHNLRVNHDIIHGNFFHVKIDGNIVDCDIMRKDNLVSCQNVYYDFLENNSYDIKKVRLLTAIIWLNMSPLHHHPFDVFLFYFGKLNLWRELKKYD